MPWLGYVITGANGENMETTEWKIENLATKDDLKRELSTIFADLKKDMEGLKISLIKWMFIFWIGQMIAVAGICYYWL